MPLSLLAPGDGASVTGSGAPTPGEVRTAVDLTPACALRLVGSPLADVGAP